MKSRDAMELINKVIELFPPGSIRNDLIDDIVSAFMDAASKEGPDKLAHMRHATLNFMRSDSLGWPIPPGTVTTYYGCPIVIDRSVPPNEIHLKDSQGNLLDVVKVQL